MNTGGNVWYQMRPNKFVDRRLFVEFLTRCVPVLGADKYIYTSMGGSHLVDHYAVYQQVGIKSLFSFDREQASIARQLINQPIDSCICERMDSNELAGKIPSLLEIFDGTTNVVAWLDYTSADRFQQLSEFENVLSELAPGDVCRITINADPRNIGGDGEKWRREKFKSPGAYRANKLRTALGRYYDSDLKEVAEEAVPAALSHAIQIAASRASLTAGDVAFAPVLLTTYKDGQRMFSATVYAHREGAMPPSILNWEYLPTDWDDVLSIDVPELSTREKIAIDDCLSRTPQAILESISFVPGADDLAAIQALESYKHLHRFVPAFQHIDLQ